MTRACVAVLLLFALVAFSANAAAKNCSPPHAVYGLIGDKWRALGAADGPLGCPTSEEMDHPEGPGRYQTFEYGAVAWSPSTGQRSVQAAYLASDGITVEWGDTSPFNYDVFLVRWDKDGQNIGQQDVSGGNRTGGKWTIPYSGLGRYRIVVEGCDRHTFSSSTCRQGWSNPVYLVYNGAPLHGNVAQGAPFDLVATHADAMGFPLNPAWAVQLANPTAGWPNADQACFDVHYGKREAHFERCTTQPTRQDTVAGPHAITCDWGATSPIHGHVNWYVATFTGTVYWLERDWPDGDYNFLITTPGDAAVTVSNPNHRLKMEFDSDETVDNFQTPWWSTLRRLVDDDNEDAVVRLMGGKQAIAIGLVGLDCVHDCASELHPLYAIAMNVKDDDADDVWAIFVRNWGNEGWCSRYRHQLQKNDFIFRLPWKAGASGVTVLNTDNDRLFLTNHSQVSGPTVTWAVNQGVEVAFHLPGPEAEARINGELHLRWSFPSSLPNRIRTSTAAVHPESVVQRSALRGLRGEEQLHDLFNHLPPAQRKSMRIGTAAKPVTDNLPARMAVTSTRALRSIPAVSIARVDVKEDAAKAVRDQLRLQAFCAAYNNRPPGMENACPQRLRPLTPAPARKPVPKPSVVNRPPPQ